MDNQGWAISIPPMRNRVGIKFRRCYHRTRAHPAYWPQRSQLQQRWNNTLKDCSWIRLKARNHHSIRHLNQIQFHLKKMLTPSLNTVLIRAQENLHRSRYLRIRSSFHISKPTSVGGGRIGLSRSQSSMGIHNNLTATDKKPLLPNPTMSQTHENHQFGYLKANNLHLQSRRLSLRNILRELRWWLHHKI